MTAAIRRVRVVLLMRKPLPGQYSVERLFQCVAPAFPDEIEAQLVTLPYESRGVLALWRNLMFTRRIQADVVHVTGDVQYCALGVPRRRCVLTVLDLVSLRRLRGLRRRLFFLLWYRLPVWWAAQVTTISDATKEELLSWTPRASPKVSCVPCAVSPAFSERGRGHEYRGRPHLLMIGTGPNKNIERVACAASDLPVHLRIVGHLSETRRRRLDQIGVSYSVKAALSDAQLVHEYVDSDVLVFVSTYEGFGLPIVEAQAVGLPVITSNLSPMREVAGAGAVLVDPYDPRAIRFAVEAIMDSGSFREALVADGRSNVERFRPELVAKQYADIYGGLFRLLACSR